MGANVLFVLRSEEITGFLTLAVVYACGDVISGGVAAFSAFGTTLQGTKTTHHSARKLSRTLGPMARKGAGD